MIPTMLPFLLYTFLSVFTFFANLGIALSTASQCDYQNISAISPMASLFAPLNSFPRQVLVARQTTCSAGPGGPICDAIHCCAAGQRCCPDACCSSTDTCWGTMQCCPQDAQTCGGTTCCKPETVCCKNSPVGCCDVGGSCCSASKTNPCCGPGESCCGDGCCLSGETCERGECISADLLNSGKVVRFELDWEKNGLLLRNMCNGMRGKNTEILTYSGKISDSEKDRKRRQAGCVSGYCRGMINSGTISSDLNSCDEYPPANSDEGGGARPTIETAVNCIPGLQNSYQGGMFSAMIKRSNIQAGEEYVISIDCEEVLNSLVPPRALIETRHEPKRVVLKTRDSVSMSGKTDSNNTFLLPNETMTSISAPFGDLDPGSYVAVAQVVSGSTANAIVMANEGDNYTNTFLGMASGQSQRFTFTLDYSDVGLGIIFGSTDNTTIISWTLEGSLSSSSSSSLSGTASPTAGGPLGSPTVGSDALSLSLESFWTGLVVNIGLFLSLVL